MALEAKDLPGPSLWGRGLCAMLTRLYHRLHGRSGSMLSQLFIMADVFRDLMTDCPRVKNVAVLSWSRNCPIF